MRISYKVSKGKVNPIELGTRIRQAREKHGMSQDELAAEIHRDQRAVSEMETGKRRVAAVELPHLARILNVPVLYFFEGTLEPSDLDHALLEQFRRLPSSEAKQSAIELIRIFSDAFLKQ